MLRVWKEEESHPTFLRLVEVDNGLQLQYVDSKGERQMAGYILTITPQGVQIHGRVNPDCGIALDSIGRVKVLFED